MKKKQDNRLIFFGLGIIVILLIILVLLKVTNKEPDYSEMTNEEIDLAIQEDLEDLRVQKLSGLNEGDRVENYVSTFMENIDNENFEAAYEVLYKDFKENFFPTYASFEDYVKNKFPTLMSLEHTNIERNGDVYVVWTTVYDMMKSRDEGLEINFVVQEYGIDDYVLSFQVN